ncbi:MAG TPA: phosphatidylglycerophosphatase A [Burkholderiales bacterium]
MSPAPLIATGFGVGLAPFAPGTFGTLAAWPLGWWLSGFDAAVVLPLIAVLFMIGVWACGVTGRRLGAADHGSMVWDEIVAFLLILAVLPRALDWQAAGFVLFRAFDIAKPWPIQAFEARFKNGFGVMGDDLIAAGYTLFVLAVFQRLLF